MQRAAEHAASTTPIGRLMKKIQCQSIDCVEHAAEQQADRAAADDDERVDAHRRRALARARGNSVTMIATITEDATAPPIPCTKRAAIEHRLGVGEAAERPRRA